MMLKTQEIFKDESGVKEFKSASSKAGGLMNELKQLDGYSEHKEQYDVYQ
jgi:hypothetical protein